MRGVLAIPEKHRASRMTYRPITDLWFLARCKYKDGAKRYGGYLGGFPERARALLGATINEPVLHVCGGLARLYPYANGFGPNDKTIDLDPNVKPDYCHDVRGYVPSGFKAMLADPPYTEGDARQYFPGEALYPNPHKLMRRMIETLEPGQRAGMIHYTVPRCPPGARFVACIGIVCGFGNRIRCFTVFERGPTDGEKTTIRNSARDPG